MDTLELSIKLTPKDPWSDILIAELAELGFDGFVETKDGIKAYGDSAIEVKKIIPKTSLSNSTDVKYEVESEIIPHQNWNATWEEDFKPVFVEDKVTIIAPFHEDVEVKGMKVVIQPQMSFGTGHHQTTWLMSKLIFELDELQEPILDMGTGTGVLAIIAEKLGAQKILAVDIEDWSAENAELNAKLNQCTQIEVRCGDIDVVNENQFGLIIANINKNILKAHMDSYASKLRSGGVLLLSGFFQTDVAEMEEACKGYNLKLVESVGKDEWAAMKLLRID